MKLLGLKYQVAAAVQHAVATFTMETFNHLDNCPDWFPVSYPAMGERTRFLQTQGLGQSAQESSLDEKTLGYNAHRSGLPSLPQDKPITHTWEAGEPYSLFKALETVNTKNSNAI